MSYCRNCSKGNGSYGISCTEKEWVCISEAAGKEGHGLSTPLFPLLSNQSQASFPILTLSHAWNHLFICYLSSHTYQPTNSPPQHSFPWTPAELMCRPGKPVLLTGWFFLENSRNLDELLEKILCVSEDLQPCSGVDKTVEGTVDTQSWYGKVDVGVARSGTCSPTKVCLHLYIYYY